VDKVYFIKDEIFGFFVKNGAWLSWILMGILGRFGYDIVNNKKISWYYVVGTWLCAVFVGYVACKFFNEFAPNKAPFMVPTITMLGNNILSYLVLKWKDFLSVDWNSINEILNKKKK